MCDQVDPLICARRCYRCVYICACVCCCKHIFVCWACSCKCWGIVHMCASMCMCLHLFVSVYMYVCTWVCICCTLGKSSVFWPAGSGGKSAAAGWERLGAPLWGAGLLSSGWTGGGVVVRAVCHPFGLSHGSPAVRGKFKMASPFLRCYRTETEMKTSILIFVSWISGIPPENEQRQLLVVPFPLKNHNQRALETNTCS